MKNTNPWMSIVMTSLLCAIASAQTPTAPAPPAAAATPSQPVEANMSASEIAPLPTPQNPALPTLYLVGDSTVRNGNGTGQHDQWGWGEPLAAFFDSSRMNVVNRALGGRSSRTYITQGHWESLLAMLKPGDIVLFQFGHNDSGPLDDTARARGSLPGTGAETREIFNPITRKHETVHTYGWYMRQYVAETLAHHATPILCSPIPRKIWEEGKIVRNTSNYGGWARQIALEEQIDFINLNEIVARRYDAMGPAAVEPLFGDPHTHTTWAGAEINAESVVAGLKALPKHPVNSYLSPKGQAVAADPGK